MYFRKHIFFVLQSGLLLFLLLIVSQVVQAQDVHFSQSLAAPSLANPSINNTSNYKYKLMSVYRQQWSAIGIPFTTSALYFNSPVYAFNKALNFYFGVNYINDKSGDAKLSINQLSLNLGASYAYGLNTFGMGVSNGLVSKNFNTTGLTFPSQYDRNIGQFNNQLESGESGINESLSYYDLGAGFYWDRIISEQFRMKLGFSTFHLNEGKETFLGGTNTKKAGYGIQLLPLWKMNSTMQLEPYLMVYRNFSAAELLLGSAIKLEVFKNEKIPYIKPFAYLRGGLNRNVDALILGSQIGFGPFDFGISYDINVSDLEQASNYKGGMELVLVYTAKNPKYKSQKASCVRY